MTRRKRITWNFGDLFAVPLKDKSYGLFQAIDLMMTNVVYIAIFNKKIADLNEVITISTEDIVSLIAITKEGLDYAHFNLITNLGLVVDKKGFKNEKYSTSGYIGAKIYDYGLVDEFLNAYHRLDYWDNWANPDYLDDFLINLTKKPKELKLKTK